MTKRFILGPVLVAALAIPGYTFAHEGHVHTLMGTVTTVHEKHLEIKATDGKTSMIILNDKTTVLRGKVKANIQEVTPGDRVGVTATETRDADGKLVMIATEVRLGPAKRSAG